MVSEFILQKKVSSPVFYPLQIHDMRKEPLKGRMCWRTKQKKATCNVSMAVFLNLSDYTGSSKS